jgi:histone-lysine N-methyltransferase SETD3
MSTPSTACIDAAEAKMQRFLQWLETHGGTFSATIEVDTRTGRIRATRALVQDELLIHIPKKLMLTGEVAEKSEIGKLMIQHGYKYGNLEYIAALILETKREGGFWAPYVDVLPQDLSGHPLLFSESDLEHLKGSWLSRLIPEGRAENQNCYDALPSAVKMKYSLDEFTWARCVAIVRVSGVRFDRKSVVAIAPLADMVRHDNSPRDNAGSVPQCENGFTLTALRPLEAGTVLLKSHGPYSNARLLYSYGFCLENNPYNETEILLEPVQDGHPLVEHSKKLGAAVAGMRSFKLMRSCADDAAGAIFSYLRLLHADATLRIDKADKVEPVSRENEIAALTSLAEACARHLQEFPTTIEEDDALLKNPVLTRNVRNMVNIRRDEKAILNYFLDLTKIALPLLRDKACDIGKHPAARSAYADYFSELARHLEISEEAKMQRMLQWLEDHGATFSKTIKLDPETRQLHAARTVLEDGLLIHIPKKLMITYDVAQRSKVGTMIYRSGSRLGRSEYLTAFLLQASREGGFWKPYVDMLPRDFSEHSFQFSESELEQLKGSWLSRTILEMQAENRRHYDLLPAPVKDTYTFADYLWARCIVATRTFAVKFNGEWGGALVPLADMANHHHGPRNNARWISDSGNGFTVTARQPLTAGTVLVKSYGRCGNGQLLLSYGFCLDDNPYNETEILLQPMHDGHPFAEHSRNLGEAVAGMRAFTVAASCVDDDASAVFAYLRLANSDASLRIENAEVRVDKKPKVPPFSRENEIAVLTSLAEACARHLQGFPTSIEEDDALLKDATLSRNMRNIVMVRRHEKVVLNYFLDLAKIALPVLREESCDISKHAVAGSRYADYFAGLTKHLGL